MTDESQIQYPHQDGDVTVLGPEIFASCDGDVICWKGENYTRQPAPAPAGLRDLYAAAIASYDHAVGQATNPAPSDHHYGQADAALAVRDRELERLQQRLALADHIHQENAATIEPVRERATDAERRVANLQSSYATLTEMARGWTQRAIENGQRAEKAEHAVDLLAEQYRALEEQLVNARSTLDRVRSMASKQLAVDECGEWERHGYHSAMAEIREALDATT